MALGLVGKKCGMTRVFTEAGEAVPVTVVEVLSNRVAQLKKPEKDGYFAVQVAAGQRKASKVDKAMAGHFAKANIEAGELLHEFRLLDKEADNFALGDEIKIDLFQAGQKIDVRGISKGKGFAGTIKRHNFSSQRTTHGNSLSHRVPGSIGQCQTPGRVRKGKKMSGHLGNEQVMIQNQEVVKIDNERNLLLVKGAIPGAPGGMVLITHSIKGAQPAGEDK